MTSKTQGLRPRVAHEELSKKHITEFIMHHSGSIRTIYNFNYQVLFEDVIACATLVTNDTIM